MTDVFEEVEGELRAERYRSVGRRLLPWIIGLALLALAIALAVWGWGEWNRRAAAGASVEYAAGLTALQAENQAEAERRFAAVAQSRSAAYKSLALMQQASIKLAQERPREAVPLLDAAADAADDEILGDAARLKAAFLVMDWAPYADQERRLRPLTGEGRPFAMVAREALAMARIQAGRGKDARRDFVVLSQSLNAPESMRNRAQRMLAAIDSGAAAQVPA
ncbi:MAG: tetratricopeptide repeat protein, partial [Pseudomonadota bacterium]|nr:tetratricopeptide repeat protein [Pseudomonadota bacterium]